MSITINATDREGVLHRVQWDDDQVLMEALRDNGELPVLASCGGTASCATCHVFLPESLVAELGERSEDEQELVEEAEGYRPTQSRLSCQVKFDPSYEDLAVELAPEEA